MLFVPTTDLEWLGNVSVRQGERPLYNSCRKGPHMATEQYARSKRVPPFARRSIFGVLQSWLP